MQCDDIESDWNQEISEAIAQASVAILLISPNFLTSDCMLQTEVSEQLLRCRKSEGLTIFTVIAKSCAWEKIDWLAKMKVRPKSSKPIWGDVSSNVDDDVAAIAQEVAVIVEEKANDSSDQDRILVLTSDGFTRTALLTAQGLTIGRKSDNDLVLDYPNVSRHHARVEFDGTNYRIIDLRSANGTYLANVKLLPDKPAVWAPGQLLRIGSNQLMLRQQSYIEPEPVEPIPPPDPILPDQPTHFSMRFKLQLTRRDGLKFKVRAIETPLGEPHALGQLPYTAVELAAILKVLRMAEYEASRFKPEENDALRGLGLLLNSHFMPDLANRIGQDLYNALITGEVNTAFQMALNTVRTAGGVVSLQLRFDEDAVELARYPWELLYHRRALLPSRAVELTRYISYPEAVTALPVTPPLRLLYIQSHPSNLPTLLGESEQTTVRQALGKLEAKDMLNVDVLSRPTYEALLDYLETDTSKTIYLLHFDGHGVFARRCPKCEAMNYPHSTHCQANQSDTICGQEIAAVEPQGYLAFEDADRRVDWIKSEVLGNLLYRSSIRLAVLSACRSSNVGGEGLFGGVAPALIQTGIPAVVATQLPVSEDVAVKFMQGFYRALARFESVPAAVNAGRLRVINTREWFIPTLYLRSQDDEGYLLKRP